MLLGCSHFRRLLYSEKYSQTSNYASGYHQQENLQPSLWWPWFSAFFCGCKTYLPVHSRVGGIWPVALVLLEESHWDADTPETSWHVPSSRVFLTLTCKVPANKQVQTQGIPLAQLWLLAHSVCQHFPAGVCTDFFNNIIRKYGNLSSEWLWTGCYLSPPFGEKKVWGKRKKRRWRVYISGHKAIRIAFPNSINSQEETVQENGDVSMSKGEAMSSARKAEGHIQRVYNPTRPCAAGAGTSSIRQD